MSLSRTDYVPVWRISAHAQSVLAAGQKHHTPWFPKIFGRTLSSILVSKMWRVLLRNKLSAFY